MRPTLYVSLSIVAAFCFVASVVPLWPGRIWWIRAFDFPRIQVAALALLVLAGWIALAWSRFAIADGVVVTGLLAALGIQGYQMFPYTPLAGTQAGLATRSDADRIKVLVANVLLDNRDASRLVEQIRAEDPDLVLVVETDQWWLDQLAEIGADYPFAVEHPLDNTYGIALYSRLELVEPEVRFLIEDDIPSIRTRVRLPSGGEIDFYGLHPRPPGPTEAKHSTERDAELIVVGREAAEARRAVIVAGDMNDVAWSHSTRRFQRISGLLDPRVGRGVFATYNAKVPLVRWPLDHVFFSAELRLVDMRRLGRFGSDHFPIVITLSHEPRESDRHVEPEPADASDRREAEEVVRSAQDTDTGD